MDDPFTTKRSPRAAEIFKHLQSPVSPSRNFEKVGMSKEYPLNILLIPLDHTGREDYLYEKMTQERVFPENSVVYLESAHREIGIPKREYMEKGKDYVYERDIQGAYKVVSAMAQLLVMNKLYKVSLSVKNPEIKAMMFGKVAYLMGIHGPQFVSKQRKERLVNREKYKDASEEELEEIDVRSNQWIALRAITIEARTALEGIIYEATYGEDEKRRVYSKRVLVLESIDGLIESKEKDIKAKNLRAGKLAKKRNRLRKDLDRRTILAMEMEESQAAVLFDYIRIVQEYRDRLETLKAKYDEFKPSKFWGDKTIPNEPWQVLRMMEKLFILMESVSERGTSMDEEEVEIFYRAILNPEERNEEKWIIGKKAIVVDRLESIPAQIEALMVEWRLSKAELLTFIRAVQDELSMVRGKLRSKGGTDQNIQEMKAEIFEMDNELRRVNEELKETKLSIQKAKEIINRAFSSQDFLRNLTGEKYAILTSEKEVDTPLVANAVIEIRILLGLAELALDEPLDLWTTKRIKTIGNVTAKSLIENIENLVRVYLHILSGEEFARQFLHLKKLEAILKRIEQLAIPKTTSDFYEFLDEFNVLWKKSVDTTLRDAASLQAVLTLAENKFGKAPSSSDPAYVFMLVGSAHVPQITNLVKANHNLLFVDREKPGSYQGGWYIKDMMDDYNTYKDPEDYYSAVQRNIRSFMNGARLIRIAEAMVRESKKEAETGLRRSIRQREREARIQREAEKRRLQREREEQLKRMEKESARRKRRDARRRQEEKDIGQAMPSSKASLEEEHEEGFSSSEDEDEALYF